MNLDMIDWAYGLGGGLLIGLASALYLLLNGRIAGISGILGGVFSAEAGSARAERLAFLAGLVGAPLLYLAVAGAPQITAPSSTVVLVAAGLLVGFGTRMGAGCTSGHGVCGLSRFSVRSLAGVVTFMAVGALTVTVVRHVVGGF